MAYPIYPESYPQFRWSPFGYEMDSGLVRTPFDAGNYRQRRLYTNMPTLFVASMVVRDIDIATWFLWWNHFGYDWFQIDLGLTPYSSFMQQSDGATCSAHIVRCTSNPQIEAEAGDLVRVTVNLELSPETLQTIPMLGEWILAGTPATASTDWILGGTPADSSVDTYTGGSPPYPAIL